MLKQYALPLMVLRACQDLLFHHVRLDKETYLTALLPVRHYSLQYRACRPHYTKWEI